MLGLAKKIMEKGRAEFVARHFRKMANTQARARFPPFPSSSPNRKISGRGSRRVQLVMALRWMVAK
jgi:hypothetical protein